MTVDQDVARQIEHDRSWPDYHAERLLTERLRALAGARKALEAGEPAALFAVRQSLVDVAAAAAQAADNLPAPRIAR